VGADTAAARLRDQLDDKGIATAFLVEDRTRPTVEKVRIVTDRHQQVARIDYEDDRDAGDEVEEHLVRAIGRAGDAADVLLVSDYLKGTITPAIVRSLIALKGAHKPLVIDPKIPHLAYYAGATLVTPNHHEAEAATHCRIRSDEDARRTGIRFRSQTGCDAALITRGEQGMWLSSAEAEGAVPAVAREVADVTGAGDTVVATLGLALAAGATLSEASILANHAAGVVVGRFGPATLTREELLEAFSAKSG
jgi:D-beta-D-heptose 7-phosphate kinase/D-beta-D-heptose 1-phosphate adenosyltransferase